ncbi:type I restriction modification DNA specificity domain protein [[Clostridium] nexile DSM 1787]|nr:type I restriction modification DNA specificity domain protein [[Clostridium] nexile DSM 1787]
MIECRTIKELCSVVVDCPHSTPTWTAEGKIVVRSNNIKNGRIDFSSPSYTDDEHFQQRIKRATPQGGDIIITREAPMGEVGMIPEGIVCCLGQRMVLLRANPEICDNYYLLYSLQSRYVQHQISWSEGTGTTVSNLRIPHLEQLKIPYLPLSKQRQVSSVLRCLEGKIEQNRVINDNLQQQAKSLFKKWFIDNPDAALWQEGTFSDLIEKTISGDWGKDTPSGNNTEMVYCIRGADIPEVRTGNKGKMPTRYILPKNYASKQLVNGDIVVEISGGSPTQSTGRAAAISAPLLARYDKGMVCTNFCKALKPITGYSMYVYHYWQYLYDQGVFFSYENGTTGIKNLDISGFLETEPISIAPEKLVKKFDTFCQAVFSKIYANGLENEQLALVRDTLLPKLMSGEIDVSGIQL